MKTEKEVRKILKRIIHNKGNCKCRGSDVGYRVNLGMEKILREILGDDLT